MSKITATKLQRLILKETPFFKWYQKQKFALWPKRRKRFEITGIKPAIERTEISIPLGLTPWNIATFPKFILVSQGETVNWKRRIKKLRLKYV